MQPSSGGRSRYELRDVLGRGGMGVIYKAYDTLMRREVALKTILDVQSKAALDLFYREWGLQASITHPNIAEIYDIGEMEYEGAPRPYFVMPLLPGVTLMDLVRTSSARLTVERSIDILLQTCRGLQAAHDRGLIHRDLKPSNIFVLQDDSVKIIDFGIAHAESSAQTSVRGTLAYMAPELLQMKPASVASDIFAMGVLSYETLTGRRPFDGATDADLSRAILHHIPPPVSELVPSVSMNVSRAIHKAIAKQPWNRFSSARELGETLGRAFRGEPISLFDNSKVLPRVERATRAFEQGEYQVATEILNELESEGHIEQEIGMLRRQVEQTQRQITVRQFLSSARRFAEEEEYSLALRKIQEALDLDDGNTDAQALKNDIEKKRRAKKMQEWADLARKHLDNNAFQHARSAVESILEIRPGDPEALAMMAELQRREQEFERLRQEKTRLFAIARDAWQRGEVTSALSNLEKWVSLDHDAPETDADRLGSLQNFYKQVRTEHEALKASYDKARQLLAEGDFTGSLAICQQYLAKYPGHALYQALKFDVEERQRQNLSACIAETDRRAETEPDLDRRVAILEEALRLYPGETHFDRALKLTRDKRDLVNSVVSRARLHEDKERFSEALDQWEILRTIHPSFPGLDYEIERVQKRRDAQARSDARANWVRQVDRLMETREFEKAGAAAAQASVEFPGDAELEQLSRMAAERMEQRRGALELAAQARELPWPENAVQALELLKEAYRRDPQEPAIRAALLTAMASRANSLAETDPESADELVGQVLEIDPGNTLGLNLRALRSDRKKEEFIGWCTAQARKLQATGDLEGAMAILQEGLSSYPNDARLNQLYSLLDRQVQGPKKTGLIEPQSTASARPAPPAPEKAREPETKTSMMELSGVAAPQTPKPAAPPAQPPQSPQAQPPAPPPQTAPVAAAPQPPAKVEPPKPQPPKPQPPRQPAAPAAGAAKKGAGLRLAAIAASLVVLAAGGWFVWQKFKSSAPQLVQVEIRTNPRGARISVNNQPRGESAATLQLAPGDYQASAELDGYQPAATSFKVALGQPVSLELALQPWKAAIRVSSEAEVTEASLAGKPLNPGAAGEYAIDGLDDGTYPLKIVSPKGEAGATLVIEGRSLPVLSGPPQAKNLTLLLIHAAGDRIAVYANSATSKAALDGQPSQPIPADGLSFPGVAAGPHQLTLEDKGAPRTIAFRTGGPPAVNVFLLVPSEADKGSILVVAGEDGAGVSINGRQYPLKTRAGQVNLGGLKPGTYKIAVAKDGFEAAPAQDVTVKQGEQTRIEFKLKPAARMASVRIQGPAGAQVLMDGQPVGVVGPDGVFSQDVSPGSHSFELKRGGEQSRQATQDFRAGETVRLGEELALRPANGAIRFDIVPAEASITIRRQGEPESAARPVTQNPASVAEGTYIVTASAPRHITSVMSVIVQGGGSATASMALRPVESAKSASAEAMGIENFDNPGAWSKDGDWRVRKGGKFVTFRPANTGGTFTFQIQLRKGKKLQWFFAFADTRNHVLFRLDRQSFSRALVANGKTTEMGRSDNPVPGAPEWELRITVEPDKIVHEIKEGGKWITLDTCRELGKDLTAGRFGFFIPEALIPGQDEYALRGFTFVPRGK